MVSLLAMELYERHLIKAQLLEIGRKTDKVFVQFCSYYGKIIHHFSDCDAPLTYMCRKNLPSNVVHTEATKVAFETLKSRMIFAPILLIPRMGHEAEFGVATDASKVGIVGVRLQNRHLWIFKTMCLLG